MLRPCVLCLRVVYDCACCVLCGCFLKLLCLPGHVGCVRVRCAV